MEVTTSAAAPPSSTSPVGSNKLGKGEFVKLLLTQLAHQDPTSPQSSEAFVAQLAQFASVELMQSANQNLEALIVAQTAGNQTGVAQLVGKDVVYRTSEIELTADGARPLELTVGAATSDVVVTVKDASGHVVRTAHLGAQEAGQTSFAWDGLGDDGIPLAPGTYSVEATASDASGAPVDVDVAARGHVDAVSFADGIPVLLVGTLKIPLGDVVEIAEPG